MAVLGRFGFGLVFSLAAVFFLLTPAALAGAQSPAWSAIGHSVGLSGTPAKFTNAVGYYVPGKYHSVTDIKGSWIVPKISSSCSKVHKNAIMETLIGVDGIQSTYYIYVGTAAACVSYAAFYDAYPNGPVGANLTIHPGDYVSAELKYSSGVFKISLKDLNTSKSFTTKVSGLVAPRTTAEWAIVQLSTTSVPLAPFGTAKFGWDYTGVSSTNTATVSGSTHPIGLFSGHVRFWMYDSTGTIIRAEALALTSSGLSFKVVWKHY